MKKYSSRIKTVALVLVATIMAAMCFTSCCPYMYHGRYGGPYDRGGSYYEQDYGYGHHHHRHHGYWGS
jgi:hypothetical protein